MSVAIQVARVPGIRPPRSQQIYEVNDSDLAVEVEVSEAPILVRSHVHDDIIGLSFLDAGVEIQIRCRLKKIPVVIDVKIVILHIIVEPFVNAG